MPMTPWNWLKRTLKAQRVRTPTLLQMEAVECGAAALGILLAYYGRIVPLAELRQACGVSRDGSKASNMVKAARLYGLEAKGFRKNLDSLRALPLPFIVFWHFNHFLVVEGWGQNRVFLNDPGTGPRSVSWAEFDEGFTGVVLLMQPGAEFRRGGHKPSLAKALWDRLKGSVTAWIYTLLLGFLLVIPGLVIPVFSQVFVDQILVGGQTDWLRPLVVGMVGTVLLQGGLRSLQLGYLRQLKLKLAAGMSGRFIWHILRLPIGFYAQRYAGEISARVALNDQVANLLSGQLGTTLIDLVMLLFYAAVMFTYDRMLTWIGIGAALINVIVLQWVARQRVDANLRLSQDLGKLAGVEISGIQSIETLKASASESDFFARWAGYYAKYLNAQQALDQTNQTIGILPPLLSALTAMLILVFGGLRVIEGHLSIGMLVAFQGLMTSFQLPIRSLVNFGQKLQDLESDLYRLDDVLQNPIDEALSAAPTLGDRPEAAAWDSPQLRGDVEFCNVTFGYSRVEAPLIESFNLRIKPGQRVALVGGSGSGKSTVAKLACGLYQPWSGEMTFDGQHRAEIPPLVLAQSLAMVEQDIFLFGGTVRDNLTLWDDTVPDADLIRACRDAEIHETLLALPGGYDSMLLEGAVNLSGGQRQRLEIARALINNPAILVLDEATSALDAETEQRIDRNLRRRGCSCLLIAHRLSTIRDCDWILVLDRGQVVEQGTHEQLWAAGGPYARLIQSEGEALRATESEALTVPLTDELSSVSQDVLSSVAPAKRGDLSALFATAPPPIQLQPYEQFALNPIHAIGWVASGPVAITAMPPAAAYPSRQHHLFDLDANASLFRILPTKDAAWTVVAIALEPISLQPLSADALDRAVRNGASEPIKALQQWCQQLQDSLQPLEQRPSLPQWSQVASASETLANFHDHVLVALADWADQNRQAIWQQLNRKAALNQSAATSAVRQLAAAIRPTPGAVVPQGSSLLVAAGAVGHALGIRIQPIRASENPDQQMDPILAIARASQVRVRRVLLSDQWWQQDAGPLLGHLRQDHTPVAILPKPSGVYEVLHPQTQQRVSVTHNVARQLEAIAYTFYRPFPTTRDRLGSLFTFALTQQGKTLWLTLLAGIAVTLLGMLTPQATGLLMDYAIPNADSNALLQMGLGLGTAALASALFQLVQNFATLRLEAIADARTQAALWDHLLKLKLAFFRQYSTGDLQSRVSAIRHIRQILSGATLRTLISSLIAFLNLGLLFVYNASLAGIALAITLVVMVLTFAASALSRRYLRRLQELQGASFGFMVQLIGGIAKLRVATAETRAFARWASRYTEQLTLLRYSQRIEDSMLLANALVPTLSNAILFTVAVGLLQAPATPSGPPAFSSGSFLAFHAAFGLLLAGATDLSNTLVHALDVSILWERSQPILRAIPEVDERTTDPGRLSGLVVLDHISFRYRDDGAMVLSDICLEAKPGDFIALVGPSGSGKSTLMRLLLGFEQPTSGRIFYDGQDLAGLDVGAVRRQLGVVLQNGKINAASLYENIAGTALVTLDEAMDAARMAGLAEDIAAMPMGMHTVISEGGSNLSGGQRQRLLIARALALNPQILFFDEATSALDNRTQDIVTQSLDQLNVTRIAIAHRLSTIRTADCIYVLSGGRIVQSGTFEQLAQQTGMFAQLMARQTL